MNVKLEKKTISGGFGLYSQMNDETLVETFNQLKRCTQESGFRIAYSLSPEERQAMTDTEFQLWLGDTDRASYRNRAIIAKARMALQEMKIRGLIEPKEVYKSIDYLNRVGT